jgi:hypothetical protein
MCDRSPADPAAAVHLPFPRILHPWPEKRFLVTAGQRFSSFSSTLIDVVGFDASERECVPSFERSRCSSWPYGTKEPIRHEGTERQGRWLCQVLRGWMAYYAVPMCGSAISAFRHHMRIIARPVGAARASCSGGNRWPSAICEPASARRATTEFRWTREEAAAA